MGRRPRIVVTERASQTDLDVLLSDPRYKARLDNPFGQPSVPIALKDDTRDARWFNAAIQTDHIWRNKRRGWDQVRLEDLVDPEQIGGYALSPEGYVTRGERGMEILMSMPKVVRRAVAAAKTAYNNRTLGNPGAAKAEVTEAAGAQLGDQAANYIQTHVNVTDNYERVARDPEAEA